MKRKEGNKTLSELVSKLVTAVLTIFHVPLFCWIKLHGGFLSHGGTPNFMGLNSIGTILWPFQLRYSCRLFSRCYNIRIYNIYIIYIFNFVGLKFPCVYPLLRTPISWVQSQAGVPFFSISASEFVEIFAGIGASRVRDLFEQERSRCGGKGGQKETYVRIFSCSWYTYILSNIYIHIMIYHDISWYIMILVISVYLIYTYSHTSWTGFSW